MGTKAIGLLVFGFLAVRGGTQACAGSDGASMLTVGNDVFADSDNNYTNSIGDSHYLPLDGALFRDTRSVDSKPVIGMGSFGFCLQRHGYTLSFARTFFSETFYTQGENTGFGRVRPSWVF